jgi:hypothetical protein
MSNRFVWLADEEEESRTEVASVLPGKNAAKHKRRAAKRAAERVAKLEAQAKRGRVEYPRRRRQFHVENDESVENRFVWYSDSATHSSSSLSSASSVILTPDMFPTLK